MWPRVSKMWPLAGNQGTLAAVVSLGSYFRWSTGSLFLPLSLVLGSVSAVIFGATVTLVIYVKLSPPHKVSITLPHEVTKLQKAILSVNWSCSSLSEGKPDNNISRKIDSAINEVLDSFVEHQVVPWYSPLVKDSTDSVNCLKKVLWFVVCSFEQRFSRVDHVRFVMCGLLACLTNHLEKIRVAEAAGEAKGERGIFHLTSQLSSPIRERNFLRLLAEFLIIRTLPPECRNCSLLKAILKEFLACKVLEPLIDRISDPDWINQQLLGYLHQQRAAEELDRRTYHYAASYEEFINLIQDSTDLGDLNHLRRNIINEIMQATAINNLKKAKGIDPNKETTPQSSAKGDLLQARNLRRYINQLTYAKAQCERRIAILKARSSGTSEEHAYGEGSNKGDRSKDIPHDSSKSGSSGEGSPVAEKVGRGRGSLQMLPGRKVLMFQVLLDSAFARRFFSIYLDAIGQGSLLGFWSAVHELKMADRRHHYQLGMEIYHTYLAPLAPPIKVDKVLLRGVEAFLLGNRGPDVLYEIMEDIERMLEDRHYAGFLVSSTYHAMLLQAQAQGIDFMTEIEEEFSGTKTAEGAAGDADAGLDVSLQLSDHSTYARNKLAFLQERLTNKLLALQAIKQTKKADPKVIVHLEGEIASIRNEHIQLEAHVDRTALWSDHLGLWRVLVHTVQVSQEKDVPSLVLFVHLSSEKDLANTPDFASVLDETLASGEPYLHPNLPHNGWLVVRKISGFIDMHRKLSQIAPWVKTLELPSSNSKPMFSKQLDAAHLERVKTTSQGYLDAIMQHEELQGSELIYAFLSPSPEHLKRNLGPTKKSIFSFSTLFNRSECKAECDEDELGQLILMNGEGGGASDRTSSEGTDAQGDSIAEPLFTFLEELCELRGVGKWLRKTLISFVQITYGKNITKHVREIVQGLLTEPMILFYIQTLRSSFWPHEDLATPSDAKRSPEDILQTRKEAYELFVQNLPELLCTLVGQQNARKGATRLFGTLQHHALNKNLIYALIEVMLRQIFPELQEKLRASTI